MVTDGPRVNLWDAIGVGLWVVALGLLIAEELVYTGCGMGPMFPLAAASGLLAAVITAGGIARRCMEKILTQFRAAYDLGYEAAQMERIRRVR